MQYGLLRVKNNTELKAEEQANNPENRVPDEAESRLASHISKVWEVNRWAKETIEDEMLECLRQRNGEYDPTTLAQIREHGGSEIYMMLTATKIRAAVSWFRDILLPAGDKAWGLNPTPIPDMPPFIMEEIARRIYDTLPETEPEEGYHTYIENRATTMRDEVMSAVKMAARDSAERMEEKIEDQLAEGDWEEALGEFIEDFATFPSAIIKGPLLQRKRKLKWGPNNEPIVSADIALKYGRVSPFDIYPSPESSNVNDGDLIERMRFQRRDLYNMIGVPGYNDNALRAVLTEYGRGGLRDWLWRDYSRAQLEGKDKFWMRQDQKTIDGLQFWGSAQGLLLLEWGINPEEIDDPLAEYEIDAIKIGRHIVRVVINKDPLLRRPYHKASYQNVPGGFWGVAIPRLMRDQQRMCNATARSLSNNMGVSSGPMVEIEVDRLADGETVDQLQPWRMFQTKSDKTGRGREAIRFYQPQSYAAELLKVYEEFERRADDATSIPRYAYGNERVGGAGATASGLAMLMNNASKGIKLAVSSIDTYVIRPIIEHTFTYNMLYASDDSIKGDVEIVARGATALLAREQTQLRRAEFMGMTNNPIDLQIMGPEGRIELLRANADLLDLNTDDIVPDRDTFIANQKAQAEQGQQQQDPAIVQIQARAQAEAAKLEAEMAQFQQKMQMESEANQQKLQAEIEKHRQKLEMERDIRLKQIDEESLQKDMDRDLEREKEKEARRVEIQRIREQVKAEREQKNMKSEKEESPSKERAEHPAMAPITLVIDNRSGKVEKTIELTRGKDKMLTGGKVTETPIEGEIE